jgi:hypothetical protein
MSEGAARARFRQAIQAVVESRDNAARLDEEFKESLLDFGSETEDNLSCVERVKIGPLQRSGAGFALRASNLSIADVIHMAEGSPIPQEVVDYFPGISQEDWDAVLRLCTLFFTMAEM